MRAKSDNTLPGAEKERLDNAIRRARWRWETIKRSPEFLADHTEFRKYSEFLKRWRKLDDLTAEERNRLTDQEIEEINCLYSEGHEIGYFEAERRLVNKWGLPYAPATLDEDSPFLFGW